MPFPFPNLLFLFWMMNGNDEKHTLNYFLHPISSTTSLPLSVPSAHETFFASFRHCVPVWLRPEIRNESLVGKHFEAITRKVPGTTASIYIGEAIFYVKVSV